MELQTERSGGAEAAAAAPPALTGAGGGARTQWLLWLAACLLLSIAQVLLAGYQFGVGNQTIQVPFLHYWGDPSLYSRDVMVQQTLRDYPSFFYRGLAVVAGDIPLAYILLHLASTFAATAAVFALARALAGDWRTAFVAVLLLLAGHHRALAGDDMYALGFTHTWAVFGPAVAAIALAFAGRYVWAFAIAGIVFNLHALTGAYVAAMLGMSLLGDVRAAGLRRGALAVGAFVLLALPTAIPMLANRSVFDAQWFDLTYLRSADHSFPSSWWTIGDPSIPRFALLIALAALPVSFGLEPRRARRLLLMAAAGAVLFAAGYVLTEVWPSASAIRAQLFRSSRFLLAIAFCLMAFGVVRGVRYLWAREGLAAWQRAAEIAAAIAVFAAVALPPLIGFLPHALAIATLAALATGRLAWWQAGLSGGVLLLTAIAADRIGFAVPPFAGGLAPWTAPALAAVPLAMALGLGAAAAWRVRKAVAASLAAVGGVVYVALAGHAVVHHRHPPADPFLEAQHWARDHTPKDALFLTPTTPGGFRTHAARSVVAEWRDGTQLYFSNAFAGAWWERITALQPGLMTSEDGRQVLSRGRGIDSLSDEQLVALANTFGATHILLPARKRTDLTPLYANDAWAIYAPVIQQKELLAPAEAVSKETWVAQEAFMTETVWPNIERHRKADLRIQIVDAAGRAVVDLPWRLEQQSHAFGFSASLPFFKVPPGPSTGDFKPPAPVDKRELERFREIFNASLIPFSGKWMYMEPRRGERYYEDIDLYIDWCEKHNIATEFHFISGYPPAWVRTLRPEEQKKAFLDHTRDLLNRYGDKIEYWQVINEGHMNRYLAEAVQEIRAIRPDAKLGLSYCSKLWVPGPQRARDRAMFQGLDEIRALKAQGVQIDFYATHAHRPFGLWADPHDMYAMFDAAAKEGVKVHITEFFQPAPLAVIGPVRKGTWTPELQADYYERFFLVAFSHPAVELVNIWGIGPVTWQEGSGLLDKDYNPKPAFTALKTLIREKLSTRAGGKLPIDGTVALRAFHGTHTLTLGLPNGRTAAVTITLPEGVPATTVRLTFDAAAGTLAPQ